MYVLDSIGKICSRPCSIPALIAPLLATSFADWPGDRHSSSTHSQKISCRIRLFMRHFPHKPLKLVTKLDVFVHNCLTSSKILPVPPFQPGACHQQAAAFPQRAEFPKQLLYHALARALQVRVSGLSAVEAHLPDLCTCTASKGGSRGAQTTLRSRVSPHNSPQLGASHHFRQAEALIVGSWQSFSFQYPFERRESTALVRLILTHQKA